MRELCCCCAKIIRIHYRVPRQIWKDLRKVFHETDKYSSTGRAVFGPKMPCLACFTKLADLADIEWCKDITFEPISKVAAEKGVEVGGIPMLMVEFLAGTAKTASRLIVKSKSLETIAIPIEALKRYGVIPTSRDSRSYSMSVDRKTLDWGGKSYTFSDLKKISERAAIDMHTIRAVEYNPTNDRVFATNALGFKIAVSMFDIHAEYHVGKGEDVRTTPTDIYWPGYARLTWADLERLA